MNPQDPFFPQEPFFTIAQPLRSAAQQREADAAKLGNPEAQARLREKAGQGDALACCTLGQMYENGWGVAQDAAQAVAWYGKAAEQGNSYARTWICDAADEGDAAALAWLRKVAGQGNAKAQCHLGVMYSEGRGVAQDQARALDWFCKAARQGHRAALAVLVKAAERGDAAVMLHLGRMYESGQGVAQDDAQAVAWYGKAAGLGHAEARTWLYRAARGNACALAWLREAGERGDAGAQLHLGRMYEEGQGVAQDDAQAVAWYVKAAREEGVWRPHPALDFLCKWARRGHAGALAALRELTGNGRVMAQRRLGEMYEQGEGVAPDKAEAAAWYRKAAELGDRGAQSSLAVMYERGIGVEQDDAQAMVWHRKASSSPWNDEDDEMYLYWLHKEIAGDAARLARLRQAAEQGHAEAQFALGRMCFYGLGVVAQDDAEAAAWYAKAAGQSNTQAQWVLDNWEELKQLKKYAADASVAGDEAPAADTHGAQRH